MLLLCGIQPQLKKDIHFCTSATVFLLESIHMQGHQVNAKWNTAARHQRFVLVNPHSQRSDQLIKISRMENVKKRVLRLEGNFICPFLSIMSTIKRLIGMFLNSGERTKLNRECQSLGPVNENICRSKSRFVTDYAVVDSIPCE